MIDRQLKSELLRLSESFPVVTVTGPRQSGKTTLCKMAFPDYEYVTLEDISTRTMIESDTLAFIERHTNGLIIDEAQNIPELFSHIQVAVDKNRTRKYVLTGSSNFSLMSKISQSLAGRVGITTLLPLSIAELPNWEIDTNTLMLNGGYPAVWAHGIKAYDLYSNYYSTYVERDVRQLINIKNLSLFQRFMKLSAARTSYEFVMSDFANQLGTDHKTIQAWNSVLETSYITFTLQPFFRNIGKRITKTPKQYFYDTGLLCYLLGIETEKQLDTHPLRGQIFENMVVVEMMKHYYNMGRRPNLYFYRDKSQNEVDVVDERDYKSMQIFEIKSSQSFHPSFTKGLDYFAKLFGEEVTASAVIYDGKETLDTQFNAYRNFRNVFAKSTPKSPDNNAE